MLHRLLPAWRGKRAVLAGGGDETSRAMHALLEKIGARPSCVPISGGSEAVCRALQSGRGTLLIVPCLNALASLPPGERLAPLRMLLGEAREAGTPLVILMADVGDEHSQRLHPLIRYADDTARGRLGDAVSVQCIQYEALSAQRACIGALACGARYLMGDRAHVGVFSLGQDSAFHRAES
ncbi:MAG: hypothetical protein E7321_04320 [Clostridiales bacterium]|nr:hypothetical protein [Clostridiales bacterium]